MKKFILTNLLLFCAALSVFAQDSKTVRDAGLWVNVGLEKDFGKDWQWSFSEEIRTAGQFARLDQAITELGLEYRIDKRFRLAGGGRYAYNRKKDLTFAHILRYHLDFKYTAKPAKKWRIKYRFRYQNAYDNAFSGFDDYRQKAKFRNRIGVEYRSKKHRYYARSEIFRTYIYLRQPRYSEIRFTAGDKIETPIGLVNLGLGYEFELNEEDSLHYLFLRMTYTFKWNER